MAQILKDLISIFVYLLATPFYRNKKAIFVYHSVESMNIEDDPNKINIEPSLFESHVKYLAGKRENYTVTLDDGFENTYTVAYPILKKYNIKTKLFITTDFIDSKIGLGEFFVGKHAPRPLRWSEINEMRLDGVEIGSHMLTHNNMASLDDKTAFEEALRSKKRIEEMTGSGVTSFSYPFGGAGTFNEKTASILKNLGYKKAYTNIMGMDNSETHPFAIRRIRISRTDNMFRFKLKASGAYNWVDYVTPLSGKRINL